MAIDAPQPGSHDRSTPTGTLEESAANLFEAMVAAREAEERGESSSAALRDFYRALMSATLLLRSRRTTATRPRPRWSRR